MSPLRAVGYIRVSTEEQVQGFSLDAQAERIKAFAISQDYTLAAIHRDEGYSAKDLNRPGIRRLLADVKEGCVDIVLRRTCWWASRLRLDLPIRQVGTFDRQGSNWHLVWWPQRDETPNGIPAEFLIKL